jgi:hypothetical protein
MASILKVDALQGITSAGDITVTSEGGAATQSLQQGLAKAWVSFNATPSVGDSLNITSLTDSGSGRPAANYISAMANDDYASAGLCGQGQTTNPSAVNFDSSYGMQSTASIAVVTSEGSDSKRDYALTTILVHGDLA